MSKVRVLVGTRKGAFVLTSDGKREKWECQWSSLCRVGDLSTSRDRRRIPIACTHRSPAAGSDR